jgi:hypothetical protein
MSAVKFSVVIPTRERADTLRFALRTCLGQSFDDYEVIVSDNFSSPATKAVVDEADSPKVRYVRTPEPVAMSRNWEFGLSHARGEFVIVIGDDDGLLPHALVELDRLARRWNPKAIRWTAAYYTWPTVALPGQGDYLRIPLGRGVYERDADATIRAVVAFRECYTSLPMLYNAAVRRDVLDELRRRTGRVFPHAVPDVYSGFAVAHVARRFLSTNVPMTVSGQSAASNGIATLLQRRGQSAIDREFHELNARAGLRCEPTVPDIPAFPHVPVADSFAFAKRVLFPDLPVELDRRALAAECLARARVSEADWPATLALVRASLADAPDLQEWFDEELADREYRQPEPVKLRSEHLGFDGSYLHLDAAAFDVGDVAAAARLCEQLLHYRDEGVCYVSSDDDELVAAMKIADLAYLYDERERAIVRLHLASTDLNRELRRLHGECEERERIIYRLNTQLRDLDCRLRAEKRWSLVRPLRAAKRLLGKLARRAAK